MKTTPLQKAQDIIAQRRQHAIAQSQNLIDALNTDAQFKLADTEVRRLRVALALSKTDADKAKAKALLNKALAKRHKELLTLGYSEDDLKPHFTCTKCNDTGYVNGKRCVCLKRALTEVLTADCTIDNAQYTFEKSKESNEHNQKVYKVCKDICDKGDKAKLRNILLTGKTGTGKTYLLSAIANRMLTQGRQVLFLTAYNLNNQFLKCHLADIADKDAYMDNLTQSEVLIIDDLGTENILKNVTIEYLFVVLNERMQNKLTTIISTNLGLQELRARYEDRIFSRIADQSVTLLAELVSADKRLSTTKAKQ